MPRRLPLLVAAAAVALLTAAPAGAHAAGGPEAVATHAASPEAFAAKRCSLAGRTRSLGPTYTTALSVRRVSCARGRSLVTAYYRCRIRRGGKKGRCARAAGFRCKERRRNVIRTQFDANVTCKRGRRVVKHSYTQFT